MNRKILVDVGVLTVAFWGKKGEALLPSRGERVVYPECLENYWLGPADEVQGIRDMQSACRTPCISLELPEKWEYGKLKGKIKQFYMHCSLPITTPCSIMEESERKQLDVAKITRELLEHDMQGEDAALIVAASAFNLNLVTFIVDQQKNTDILLLLSAISEPRYNIHDYLLGSL
ncbi:MAG: hypothetical protein HYY37_03260 [Candidatus Aenigmarchaeota archaeon]|nr:hypothetical protein [Candidatus Aenigmarchaeota archaeon]